MASANEIQSSPSKDVGMPGEWHGLTEAEAARRMAEEGPNELPADKKGGFFSIVLEVVREPMLALLLIGGIVYLILGDLAEAIFLLVFATFSVIVTVVQEARTERVLETLRDLSSPRALVVRDGERRRIAGRDVVRGDAVVLGEGDRIPADGILRECHELETDESLLTGESVPVRKRAADSNEDMQDNRPGGDDKPFVYSGSLVVRGRAVCEVTATGPRSEIGKIGLSLGRIEHDRPRLSAQIRSLVQVFAILGGTVSVAVVILYGLLRGTWLDGILAGIALGMSMMPEEFPVVLTVFMAMGAWRISKVRVLTRKASAIETLGSATVLCTDKTGTLTENRMAVARLVLSDGRVLEPGAGGGVFDDDFRLLAGRGILACPIDPSDPMEKAFFALSGDVLPDGHPGGNGWTLAHEYGLRSELLAVTQVWNTGGSEARHTVAAKGAPEAIVSLCRLDDGEAERILAMAGEMAEEGLRVLAVAEADYDGADWPETPHGFDFRFLGLTGLADGLRTQVPAAVAELQRAGIRVVMITGDYPKTAVAIARKAGITTEAVISGEQMAALDDEELAREIRNVNVFARIMPEQKLRIVQAFKRDGEVVAMTGDGVNDAPSLKAAHIGIAMGGRGTDVAREASSIVLMDDDFSAIAAAVRLGRRIYDNIRKATLFILAVHMPIAGLALLPLLFGTPVILWPVHIALLELAIDPTCSLVFEAENEETDIMARPPRSPQEKLLPGRMVLWGAAQGMLALLVNASVYIYSVKAGLPAEEVRALTFLTLILSILSLVLVNRSFSASVTEAVLKPNDMLLMVAGIVGGIMVLSLVWPLATHLLLFAPLALRELAVAAAAAIGLMVVLELAKFVLRHIGRGRLGERSV